MPLSQIVSDSIQDGAVAPVDLSSVSQYTGFKNRIINGGMTIDQRNGGALASNVNGYCLDRWYILRGNVSSNPVFNVQQVSSAPSGAFKNSLSITVGTAGAPGTTNYSVLLQYIEGFNVYDLAWGSSSASTITLSFWVNCSVTGTYGAAFQNSANTRTYVASYTINAANTWEQKTITIVGCPDGAWLTNNGIGLSVYWDIGVGTTQSTTAGSWQSGNYLGLTGGTKLSNTASATFLITGVQLEKGSTATSFDYRPYTTELQLCQRYYASFVSLIVDNGPAVSNFPLPVTMRATPTWTGGAAGFTVVGYTNGNTSGYMYQSGRAVNALMTASAEF